VLQPAGWPQPRGLAHGVVASGQMIFVAGMLGADEAGRLREGFVAQAKQALRNIVAVLGEAGASPGHIVRLTWYICDMDEYLSQRSALGVAYREVMGRHFPAMAVVEINRLIEPNARLEIEATAVL
jgi:enamine deaminase RidA (YjgF/YER057c/UK114 family)